MQIELPQKENLLEGEDVYLHCTYRQKKKKKFINSSWIWTLEVFDSYDKEWCCFCLFSFMAIRRVVGLFFHLCCR